MSKPSGWVAKFFGLAALIVGIQVIAGFAIAYAFDSRSDRGTFGDMFGAVNTLFSGLALAGIILAIFVQRDELVLQREELELQREELKLQREEMERTRAEIERSAAAQEKTEKSFRRQVYLQALSALATALAAERTIGGHVLQPEVRKRLESIAREFPEDF